MQLQDYKKIEGLVQWSQFTEMLQDAYVKQFEEISKRKYGEYREMRRFLRDCIKRFPRRETGATGAEGEQTAVVEAHPIGDDKQAATAHDGEDFSDEDDDEFAMEGSGSAVRMQHVALIDESPISFIRKQLEQQTAPAVPLSQLAVSQQQKQQPAVEEVPPPTLSPNPPSTSMEHSGYEITQEKVFQPSTEENYNIDDLSSNDDTDDDEHPRKTIPAWAQRGGVAVTERLLSSLVTQEQRQRHFGKILPPTTEVLFKETQKKHKRGMQRSPDESMEWESSTKK